MDEIMLQTKYRGASVYQSKPLIEACKKFDINEGRLFYLGLLELRPQLASGQGQEKFTEVVIPTTDVIKLFGGNLGYYSKLKNVAKKLINHSIAVRDDDNSFKYISIFDMLYFDKKLGGLHLKFNDTMRPYILELADKPYTKIAVKTIFALTSHYAIRLMELMLEYQNIVEFRRNNTIKRQIMIEDLRFYCGIEEKKYNKTNNFTKNVVERPCREINASTPYEISYEYIKKGRTIIGYDFTLKLPKMNDSVETIEQLVESNQKIKIQKVVQSADRITRGDNTYSVLLSCGIGKIVASRLLKKYNEERIWNNIEYVKQCKNIKNLGAYLRKAIEEDYYSVKNIDEISSNYIQDMPPKNNENIERELANLGFGPLTANMLIESVKQNGRFGITEKNMCKQAGIEPDSLFEAIKSDDFSTLLMLAEEATVEEIPVVKEKENVMTNETHDTEEIFLNTILSGEKVTTDFVKKAAKQGINLGDLASTLGMSIKECIKIEQS